MGYRRLGGLKGVPGITRDHRRLEGFTRGYRRLYGA